MRVEAQALSAATPSTISAAPQLNLSVVKRLSEMMQEGLRRQSEQRMHAPVRRLVAVLPGAALMLRM